MAKLNSRIKLAPAVACCLALATAGGCRNLDNAQVDVLERELRQQEDYIYELEDYLISYSEKLRQCRMAGNCQPTAATPASSSSSKKKPIAGEPHLMEDLPRPAPKPSGTKTPSSIMTPPAAPPASEAPAAAPAPTGGATEPEVINPQDIEVPELEFGPGASILKWKTRGAVAAAAPSAAEQPAEESPLYIPDPVDYQVDAATPAAPAEAAVAPPVEDEGPSLGAADAGADRLTAQRLEIRRIFGEPTAEEPAKLDRLMIVVEALSEANEPVDAFGEASIMVMARDETGALARVERWDFTPEETAAAWQSSRLGDGLHLELPLSGRELPAGKLELWARLVSTDGAKLLASLPLEPTQLTSVENALPEAPIIAAEPLPRVPELAEQAVATAAPPAKRRSLDEPQWRASAQRLDRDRVEGFASTAAGKPGWKTQAPLTQVQRVAAATTDGAAPPTTAPTTSSNPKREWTPFR